MARFRFFGSFGEESAAAVAEAEGEELEARFRLNDEVTNADEVMDDEDEEDVDDDEDDEDVLAAADGDKTLLRSCTPRDSSWESWFAVV